MRLSPETSSEITLAERAPAKTAARKIRAPDGEEPKATTTTARRLTVTLTEWRAIMKKATEVILGQLTYLEKTVKEPDKAEHIEKHIRALGALTKAVENVRVMSKDICPPTKRKTKADKDADATRAEIRRRLDRLSGAGSAGSISREPQPK